jgi:paraquat-inducible protein B
MELMMSKQGNKAAIGAFVVGAVVLAIVGILAFGSGALFRDKNFYVMYFDGNLKGLDLGAPVAFRGVRVGQVSDIRVFVDSDTYQFTIPVVVEIDPQRFHEEGAPTPPESRSKSLKALIDKGLRAKLGLQNIVMGQLMIQLDMFPDEPAQLRGKPDELEIPTIPSGFERLSQALENISFGELVDNLNQAVKQFGDMLDDQELEKVFFSIRTAADDIAVLARNLNRDVIPMVQSMQRTSDDAGQLIRDLDRNMDPTLAETRAVLTSIQQAMAQADQTLKSINTLSEGYTERSAFRYEVSNALREVAAAARSLRALSDMLQQQPDALIRGKGNLGGQ